MLQQRQISKILEQGLKPIEFPQKEEELMKTKMKYYLLVQ